MADPWLEQQNNSSPMGALNNMVRALMAGYMQNAKGEGGGAPKPAGPTDLMPPAVPQPDMTSMQGIAPSPGAGMGQQAGQQGNQLDAMRALFSQPPGQPQF